MVNAVEKGDLAKITTTDGRIFLFGPNAMVHALALSRGLITERPPNHEKCVMCDAWFGSASAKEGT